MSGAAIIHMIFNNLDPQVAQFPEELVTYGGNGQVFSNWAQVRLFCLQLDKQGRLGILCLRVTQPLTLLFQFWMTLHYLMTMTDEQTLSMYSGHPMGLFPTGGLLSPRMVITNGMVVPNYSSREEYDKMFALNVTM